MNMLHQTRSKIPVPSKPGTCHHLHLIRLSPPGPAAANSMGILFKMAVLDYGSVLRQAAACLYFSRYSSQTNDRVVSTVPSFRLHV